jgi:hypothetical protein
MNPTIFNNGSPWDIALLPLSGRLTDPLSITSGPTLYNSNGVVQTIPRDGTVTTFSGWFYSQGALALIASTLRFTGKLYLSPNGQDALTSPSGGSCTTQPLSGVIGIGTIATFMCTGLSIPVTQGSIGFFTLEAAVTGAASAGSIPVQGSMSISIS